MNISINYNPENAQAIPDGKIDSLFVKIESIAAISPKKNLSFCFSTCGAIEALAMAQFKNKSGHKWTFLHCGSVLRVENGKLCKRARIIKAKAAGFNFPEPVALAAAIAANQPAQPLPAGFM